uniref:Uncharacterized protein n=1 Tax=Rhizophora mucronata TaxID=61149 RepID=A0A2P2NY28_RHIMU
MHKINGMYLYQHVIVKILFEHDLHFTMSLYMKGML